MVLRIGNARDLMTHPKLGVSWEGYVIEEVLSIVRPDSAYFWATHQGAEIDLILLKDGRTLGIECKRTDAPRMTPSIRSALTDLELDSIIVIYPGDKRFTLSDRVEVLPLKELAHIKRIY